MTQMETGFGTIPGESRAGESTPVREHEEEITRRWQAVCMKILADARTMLYLDMRYLDLALSSLAFVISTELPGIGTDGKSLVAHPKVLSDLFEENALLVNRVYLHLVLHCLLRHPFKAERADERLWRLSCDIAVESIIDDMRKRSVRRGANRIRRNCYDLLRGRERVLTAERVYHDLAALREAGKMSEQNLAVLEQEFEIDDHSLWLSAGQKNVTAAMQQMQDHWQDISEKTQTRMETTAKESASGDPSLRQSMRAENRDRWDYRSFLRRFAVYREEMHTDPDTFDYVFYTYGLSLYGNMPLIEPQEFREVKKIQDFVVVIDVSMSTSGPLVQTFLDQTWSVLTERESYLSRVNIRILQCDEAVRSDVKITCREELEEYLQHFTLTGGGGTDFRPAFAYVRELCERDEFRDLRGMIYFTDGHGIYPKRRPPWETAFVFMEEDYTDKGVPPWAIRLLIEREDLETEEPAGILNRTDYHFLEDIL